MRIEQLLEIADLVVRYRPDLLKPLLRMVWREGSEREALEDALNASGFQDLVRRIRTAGEDLDRLVEEATWNRPERVLGRPVQYPALRVMCRARLRNVHMDRLRRLEVVEARLVRAEERRAEELTQELVGQIDAITDRDKTR